MRFLSLSFFLLSACGPAFMWDNGATEVEIEDTAVEIEDTAVEIEDDSLELGPQAPIDPDDLDNPYPGDDEADADDDGSPNSEDCDDHDDDVYPGATERCDGEDNDCDGEVDEGCESSSSYTFYRDADADGYGNASVTTIVSTATAPSGYVGNDDDCDDTDASVHPGATETCDSEDDDCDGATDEGVTTTFYRDADADGYGSATTTISACSAPSGYVANSTDCNDSYNTAYPGATESCNDSIDNDCDGDTNEGCTGSASDDDRDGYTEDAGDCNDTDASVRPGATETCNYRDDDCDGSVDEGTILTFYRDADSDGYGVATTTTTACSAPTGYVANSTDCNDSSASVRPGATETCNSVDDDCDGSVDEGVTSTYYRDADSDGYGVATTTTTACSAPTGYVSNSTDCNDSSASVHPGATEANNSIDDDCDGTIDEGFSTTTDPCGGQLACFANEDSDSYNDVLYVHVSLFTQGSTYQTHDAVVVGIGGSWDMNDDNVAIIDDASWFVVDPSTWSCGVEHDITLVSSLDNDGVDMFDEYDCDTDEEIETTACDGVVGYSTWSAEGVWLQNYAFCTGGSSIASQICENQGGTSYLFSLVVDCGTRLFHAS
jgi:hypothetical protein